MVQVDSQCLGVAMYVKDQTEMSCLLTRPVHPENMAKQIRQVKGPFPGGFSIRSARCRFKGFLSSGREGSLPGSWLNRVA